MAGETMEYREATATVISRAGAKGLMDISNYVERSKSMDNFFPTNDSFHKDENVKNAFAGNGITNRLELPWYTKFNRFTLIDPYNALGTTKEYLFFTKPDLHIFKPGTTTLNPQLKGNSFFNEFVTQYPGVALQLQRSAGNGDENKNPFMNILTNSVKNTLDLPSISANMVDHSATIYGSTIEYRGDGYASDENHDFSLEFEDTKYLEVYHLFKAIEEYARLKKQGVVSPPNIDGAPTNSMGLSFNYYLKNQKLHDQIAVYKIVTDEDFETILYYAMLQGVVAKSVPREAFSDIKPDGGMSYSVEFHARYVFDMEPWILASFDKNVNDAFGSSPKYLDIYNSEKGRVDHTWATAPYIAKQMQEDNPSGWLAPAKMKYRYKLKWRES